MTSERTASETGVRQIIGRHGDSIGDRTHSQWIAFIAILLAIIVSRAMWFGDPVVTTDEQLYALIGNRLADGHLPYLDLWDRKPFGLFAIFALGEWIGRVLDFSGPQGYQILAALFTLAGGWLTYLLARRWADEAAAIGAGALYALTVALYGSQSGQSEAFHAPMMVAMMWLLHDRHAPGFAWRAALAMLIGGIALQVKYTVLPQCAFFGLLALWQWHRLGYSPNALAGKAVLYLALGLLPTAAVMLLYWSQGGFDAWWFANIESFFLRGASGRLRHGLIAGAMPLLILAVAGSYLHLRTEPKGEPEGFALTAAWFVAALGTVFLPGTVYLYYFAALVAPTLLLALPLLSLRIGRFPFGLTLVIAGIVWLTGPISDWRQARSDRAAMARISAAISPYVDGDTGCLLVYDGPTALYRSTGSCLPTRYIYPDHLNNSLEATGALGVSQAQEVARILAKRPAVIVTTDEPLTIRSPATLRQMRQAIARDYRPLATGDIDRRTTRAWLRKGLGSDE